MEVSSRRFSGAPRVHGSVIHHTEYLEQKKQAIASAHSGKDAFQIKAKACS